MAVACAQLTFSEAAESNAGPFTVEAHVRSIDDDDVFKPGIGKVRPCTLDLPTPREMYLI